MRYDSSYDSYRMSLFSLQFYFFAQNFNWLTTYVFGNPNVWFSEVSWSKKTEIGSKNVTLYILSIGCSAWYYKRVQLKPRFNQLTISVLKCCSKNYFHKSSNLLTFFFNFLVGARERTRMNMPGNWSHSSCQMLNQNSRKLYLRLQTYF